MTIVFLVNGSSSPYNKPGDWNDAGHQIELVGCGGTSGASSTGTSGRGGGGGGGGAYVELDYSSGALSATTPFYVGINATVTTNVVATKWGSSSNAALTNSYYAENGRAGVTIAGGALGSATTVLNGTPPTPVYTKTLGRNGGNAGTPANAVISGGSGGGGAGGPAAAGGGGGSSGATAGWGGGGGGAGNNVSNGVTSSSATGGNGGTGVGPSHGGGAGSSSTTSPGNGSAGVGGQGGGGGCGSTTTTVSMVGSGYAGGPNGNASNWVETVGGATAGAGAGGGGGGGFSGNVATTSGGGDGGNYGGGGGGRGGTRGSNAGAIGQGASGLIVITYGIADAWNVADKSATVTLSNSDKTASTAAVSAVRSTTANLNGAAGKYYAEFLFVSGTSYALGLKRPAPSSLTAESEAVYVYEDGSINNLTSGAIGTVGGAFVGGDVIGVAYDALTRTVWFRKNSGLWNNDAAANPATGTNGLPGPIVTVTSLCLWLNVYNTAATSVTVRTEAADLTLAGPSGFTSWMGEALGPPPDTVTVTEADVTFTGQTVTIDADTSVPVGPGNNDVEFASTRTRITARRTLLYRPLTIPGRPSAVAETTPVTQATVTFTGKTVTLVETDIIPVLKASVTVAGKTVTIRESEVTPVAQATVTYTGKTVTSIDGDFVPVLKASVTVTGKTILGVEITPTLISTVTVTGKTVTVREAEVTPVAKATVTVIGKPLTEFGLIPVNKASVVFAGQTVNLLDPGVDRTTVDPSAVLFTGKGVFEREVPVSKGSVLYTGQTVTLIDREVIPVLKASVTVIGKTVTVRDAEVTPVLKASVTVTGKTVTVGDLEFYPISNATVLYTGKTVTVRETEPVLTGTVTFAGQTVTLRDLAPGVEPISPGSITVTGKTVTVLDVVPELPFTSRQTTTLARRTLLYRPLTAPTGETPAPVIPDLPFPQGQTSILARWALLYPSSTSVPLVTAPGIDLIPVFPATVLVTGKTVTIRDADVTPVVRATVLFAGKTVTVTDFVGTEIIPVNPATIRFIGQEVTLTGTAETRPPIGGGGGVPSWIYYGRKQRRRYRALEEIERRLDKRIETLKTETKEKQQQVAEFISQPVDVLSQQFADLLLQQALITGMLLEAQRRAELVRQERIQLAILAQRAAEAIDEEEAITMLLLT